MRLPREVADGVLEAIRERRLGTRIEGVEPVGGGCINNGARIRTESDGELFLKWNAEAPADMFAAEADGLRALRAVGALRVPRPVAWSQNGLGACWLLLEYVPSGRTTPDTPARLARGLAEIHASSVDRTFGWHCDNYIGSLPQTNAAGTSWADFWRERRIVPQLETARRRGYVPDPMLDRLVDLIPSALEDVDRPELLHGDLWSGNWFATDRGEPVLIDPAVYRGHGEVDLAMSELFGGFGAAFYDEYAEIHGITEAYRAYRKDLYQLYYLLVHVNLFGRSYEAGSLAAARRVVAALGR